MPVVRTGRETNQNRIRLDNLADEAERRLSDIGRSPHEIQRIFGGNLRDRVTSLDAWNHPQEGLAIFAAEGRFEAFNSSRPFQERVVVGKRFHLRPMLQSTEREGRFYILAVSMNSVRLFEADEAEARELHPEGLPTDLVTALNIDEFVQHLDYRQSQSTGQAGDMFNGQGGSDMSNRKEYEIVEFFREIDRRLSDFFGVERFPLVFAGVEYLFPIFKETSHYNALVGECVPGNPDLLNASQLHAAAWKLVEPIFDEDRRAAAERYLDRIATDLTTDDPATILAAAERGQVDVLLLRGNAERWGRFDGDRFEDSAPDDPQAEDLYDLLAGWTLTNGGRVFTVDGDVLDDERPAGALLRYSLSSVMAGAPESSGRSRRS
jgi:uncharacterized protein YjiS (DUF1127 family)